MTLHLKMPSKANNLSPRILVIGVGGAGGNIINSMIASGVEGVEFLNVNTDSQQLKHSNAGTLQLGPSCTLGLGAGADPDLGKKAAEEVSGEIEEYVESANMVFLTAGMGGGTGTGATPVVARIAKDLGILTVGVVTKPFEMEGKRKTNRAEDGIIEVQKYVDNLIVIPNQNIFHLAKPETSFVDALQFANDVLIDGVKSIIDLMVKPGIMNHDFADVKAVMSETGKVHLGTGIAEGDNKITDATEKAVSNPLLENNSMTGAKGVLINITCGDDTGLHDIDLAINRVRQESDEDANIIWGVQKEKDYKGKFKISVISTGIDSENYYKRILKNESFQSAEKIIQNQSLEKGNEKSTITQSSFFVDLQPSPNKEEISDSDEVLFGKEESTNKKNSKKFSFLQKLFGRQNKHKSEKENRNDFTDNEDSKIEFKNEMKEVFEKTDKEEEHIFDKKENESDNIEDLGSIKRPEDKSNDIDESFEEKKENLDDELLQIPAFLRRQAN